MFFASACLTAGSCSVEVAAQGLGVAGDEVRLALDGRDVLEHRLALVRVDAERADHVHQRVRVDVLLVGVAAQHQLQLRRRDHFAHDVDDVVAHDAFGGGKVADGHLDDPAVHVRDRLRGVAPLLAVLLHRHVLRLPVVRLHLLVQLVRPGVLQRQDVEEHRLPAVDDALGGKGFFGFRLVENERFRADFVGDGFCGHGGRLP